MAHTIFILGPDTYWKEESPKLCYPGIITERGLSYSIEPEERGMIQIELALIDQVRFCSIGGLFSYKFFAADFLIEDIGILHTFISEKCLRELGNKGCDLVDMGPRESEISKEMWTGLRSDAKKGIKEILESVPPF